MVGLGAFPYPARPLPELHSAGSQCDAEPARAEDGFAPTPPRLVPIPMHGTNGALLALCTWSGSGSLRDAPTLNDG